MVDERSCPVCRSELTIQLFPAFTQPPPTVSTASGEAVLDGEAACYFHPEKRADVPCDRCGRFLCALCDVPLGGKHLCPSCLDTSKTPELVSDRFIWPRLAMLVGVVPFFLYLIPCFWFFSFAALFTGPAAIFLALWKWNAPASIVSGRGRGMGTTAIVFGVLQIMVFAGASWLIVRSMRHG